MITVNELLCTGCGVCVEICPSGAIRLEEGIAVVDQVRCTLCEVCLEQCPQGAIFGVSEPVPERAILPSEGKTPEPIQVRVEQVAAPPSRLRSGILPAVTGALVTVGRELPRILPAVLDLLDRRPPQTSPGSRTPSKQVASKGRGGGRHRHRRRGG